MSEIEPVWRSKPRGRTTVAEDCPWVWCASCRLPFPSGSGLSPTCTCSSIPSTGSTAPSWATGVWERKTWLGLAEHIPKNGVFVDVGAHIGYYSLKAASLVGPGGRVLAVEPNPETVRRLRANIRESGASEVVVEPVACSDSDGMLEFFAANEENAGASSLSKANAAQAGPVAHSYRVRARRLDDIVRESGVSRVDVMKIDVEGAELLVLKGAGDTLDRFHPVVAVELIEEQLKRMGTSSADVIAFFRTHGYAVRHVYDEYHNTEFAFVASASGASK